MSEGSITLGDVAEHTTVLAVGSTGRGRRWQSMTTDTRDGVAYYPTPTARTIRCHSSNGWPKPAS